MTNSILIEALDERALSKRRRRFCQESACHSDSSNKTKALENLQLIPAEWRELLIRWVKRGGKSRWETLLKDAGTTQLTLAESLFDWLVREGWAIVIEERKHGDWWPTALELRDLSALRLSLGLSDKHTDEQRWQTLREELHVLCDTDLAPALLALDQLHIQRALARYDLVSALQRWQAAQQSGTRRDFALHARNDTKGISESEWNWLEQTLDLAEFRIERHTPLLLISATLSLKLANGQLELCACTDFAALTPATLQNILSVSGEIARWQLIENRTSFERIARRRAPDTAVVWLPGYPPGWWCTAMKTLLDLAYAPAEIACDPDPAGINIALKAAELWQQRKLPWQPWKMSAQDLANLRVRKPLTTPDRLQLDALPLNLPVQLQELADWMREHGEKGEQEGYL